MVWMGHVCGWCGCVGGSCVGGGVDVCRYVYALHTVCVFCCMLNQWLLIYNTYLCRYGQLDNKKGSIDRWTDKQIYILVLYCVGGLKLIYCINHKEYK